MRKKFVSLLTKFAFVFFIFTLVMLIMNGASVYYNQTRIDRTTRLTHMQQINTYFDSLIVEDGETFLAYQTIMQKYGNQIPIPIDVEGYGDAELDFYESFYAEYPDGVPGENPSYLDMSEDLQIKFAIFQHEYWLDLFEKARPDMDLIYTYYVTLTDVPEQICYMIDAVREPNEELGEQYMNLRVLVDDYPRDGHENMWYALEKGEPTSGYDIFDNEYGKTYAYFRPVIIDNQVLGAIGIEVEIANVNHDILRNTLTQLFSLAAILIIAVAILLYWINTRYIKKIEHLSGRIKDYAEIKDAGISSEIENDMVGNDELSALANQTAAMILELDNYMRNIIETTKELNQTREHAERMGELATLDSLTGVKNKTAYDEEVRRMEWALDDGESDFGICVIDLNYLKRINDTYGHERGNEAIKRVCQIACDVFVHSPVFRIGGDEFTIILRNSDYENADELIKKFKDILNEIAQDRSLKPWEAVSAAIGYARFDERRDSSVVNVFRRADKAMYDNKKEMKAARA